MFNASSGTLAEQTAIFAGALNIIEGGHASPGAPQVSGKLLDSILAVLTVAAILLAIRGVASSRRWAARLAGSPILAAARLAPLIGVLVLVSSVPKLAGWLLDGRDFTWMTILYSSPALVVFAVATALAATVTLSARAWQLGALAPQKTSRSRLHFKKCTVFRRRHPQAAAGRAGCGGSDFFIEYPGDVRGRDLGRSAGFPIGRE